LERGLVRDDGKAYGRTYRAGVPRGQMQRSALRRLVDTLFAGSAEAVVLQLVDEGEVDAEKLAELQARLTRGKTGR
ncbi:MAG: BlaI/MecI/CopY family transcriptional regulator, partial [Candidatus Latescibacterota bacterium]